MAEPVTKPFERFVDFISEATRMFGALSMAIDAKKLVIALAGVVLWGVGAILVGAVVSSEWWYLILIAAALAATGVVLILFAKADVEVGSRGFIVMLVSTLIGVWAVMIVLWLALRDPALQGHKLFICQSLWGLAVASFFGTAICRIAAVNCATEESVSFRDAVRFSLKKLPTSIWTLLFTPAAVVGFGIILVCFGILGRVPAVGQVWYVVVGIVYIAFLLVGLLAASMLLVYLPGLALFQPAIAAEGQDTFDAFSRAYGFIIKHPWRFAFYSIAGYIYGRIVVSVAAWVVLKAGQITNAALSMGVGEKMRSTIGKLDLSSILGAPFSLSGQGPAVHAAQKLAGGEVGNLFTGVPVGGWFIIFWQFILLALFLAFAMSLFYCLITHIYFLMRKAAYGTPFDEVYAEQPEEEQFAGQFPEAPKPAEPEKPTIEETVAKQAGRKKAKEDLEKPIDLSPGGKKLDIDEEESE